MQRPFYRRRRFWAAVMAPVVAFVLLAVVVFWPAPDPSAGIRVGMTEQEVIAILGDVPPPVVSPSAKLTWAGEPVNVPPGVLKWWNLQGGQVYVIFDRDGKVMRAIFSPGQSRAARWRNALRIAVWRATGW